jgi:D-alanyl-D-alanine carboxypeptidase/D-alanyl-D-alanine-endopeptidase (penicillin-binding protein 4)
VKRTLTALVALLAAGLTLVLPDLGRSSAPARPAARPVAAAETALVPGTHVTPSPGSATGTSAGSARWIRRLDKLVAGVPVSVAVEVDGESVYRSRPAAPRVPASNEKLLLSMALLDTLGPAYRIQTRATATQVSHGVVRGDLWLQGAGDPTISSADLGRLAHRVRESGVRRVTGSVEASVEPFHHDWSAPGWKPRFRREEVALPTALTFERNTIRGKHVRHPERYAAASFSKHLRAVGVAVEGKPGTGRPPEGGTGGKKLASISSPSLLQILHAQNVDSVNFFAEVLNKLLGFTSASGAGTIAGGAAEIQTWAAARGVDLEAHDGSGLSYANRVSASGMVELLQSTEAEAWGPRLRSSLPHPGQGTLRGRLPGVKLHAKTGTLHVASAISGWVWLKRVRAWAPFSILVGDIDTLRALTLEDAIVRILAKSGRVPVP